MYLPVIDTINDARAMMPTMAWAHAVCILGLGDTELSGPRDGPSRTLTLISAKPQKPEGMKAPEVAMGRKDGTKPKELLL